MGSISNNSNSNNSISDKSVISENSSLKNDTQQVKQEGLIGGRKISYNRNENSIPTKADAEAKIKSGTYVPFSILKSFGMKNQFKSIKDSTTQSMSGRDTLFAEAKPASRKNLKAPDSVNKPQAFPKSSLTRFLTGDTKPEWIAGIGVMAKTNLTEQQRTIPEEQKMQHGIVGSEQLKPKDASEWSDPKDCFVSSLEEYERAGMPFNGNGANDPVLMGKGLHLDDYNQKKVEKDGAWLIEIHPSSKLAIPTERKHEKFNEGYVEGGYTSKGQQEWVTPNVPIEPEARANRAKIFKIDVQGGTVEWKFFQGKLLPDHPNSGGKCVPGSYNHAINEHISKVAAQKVKNTV